ncbi:F-box/kelch-repeat protein At5g43190-like [Zingiber officinale]|uniref:F-box/kelch-repeat protein At5g43190-like n=1 Tax=Zingiber officinale TaxID=94328 RepID=UPI001C4BDAEC|nr:F-box/kelch-repeat protein At5g43190-like [Zingiber officinale]
MPRARAQRRASNQIEKMKKVMTMDPSIWGRLPDELLDRIIAFLPLRTILALRPTCRRFRSFLSSPAFLSLLHSQYSPSYLLLSHPQFSDRCLPIYDSVADQWRSVSLPSSFADACSPSSVLLSSASGLLCFSLGRSALLVANLLTSSLKILPLPVYSASSPSAVTLVSFPSPSNSKRGYKIFLPSDSADAVFLYDSASLAWTRFSGFESVLRRGNPRQAGAFFEASLYFTTPEPFSVVGFDLRSGSWDIDAAPALPEDMAFVRLVGGGGRLYLVGGVGRDGISRSLKIWELVGRAWEELGRLPDMMCRKFVSVCYHNYSHVQCLWHEGLVCVCCTTWPEVLFYRVARATWHWLPRCPMLQEKWSCGFHWFSFSPDLFALV